MQATNNNGQSTVQWAKAKCGECFQMPKTKMGWVKVAGVVSMIVAIGAHVSLRALNNPSIVRTVATVVSAGGAFSATGVAGAVAVNKFFPGICKKKTSQPATD